jgi:hypothetical protein
MLLAAERTPAPEARITTPYGDYSSLAVSHGLVTVKENRYKVGYLGYVWSTLGLQQSITIRHNKNHQGTPQTHIHLHTPAITYTYTQTHTHTHNRRAQRACGQKGRETARRRGHAGEWVENSVCVWLCVWVRVCVCVHMLRHMLRRLCTTLQGEALRVVILCIYVYIWQYTYVCKLRIKIKKY